MMIPAAAPPPKSARPSAIQPHGVSLSEVACSGATVSTESSPPWWSPALWAPVPEQEQPALGRTSRGNRCRRAVVRPRCRMGLCLSPSWQGGRCRFGRNRLDDCRRGLRRRRRLGNRWGNGRRGLECGFRPRRQGRQVQVRQRAGRQLCRTGKAGEPVRTSAASEEVTGNSGESEQRPSRTA